MQLRSCQRQRARRGASVSAAAACGVAPGAVVRYLHAAALVLSRSLAALSCSRVSYSILKGECQEWFQWSQTLSPSARHARVALQLGVDRRVRPQLTTEKTACTGACAGPCTGCKGFYTTATTSRSPGYSTYPASHLHQPGGDRQSISYHCRHLPCEGAEASASPATFSLGRA